MTRDRFIEKYTSGHYGDSLSTKRRLSEIVGLIYDFIGGSTLDDLTTEDTDSLVDAINELVTSIGDLTSLSTTATDDLVSAINELLTTIGDVSSLTTTEQSEIVGAINELVTSIGTLSSLTTTAQSNLVAAINEVVGKLGAEATPVDGVKAAVTIDMTNPNGDLTYTAKDYGTAGNSITVTHVDPSANDQSLAIAVDGTDITITLATDGSGTITSTANDIKTAIEADSEANALVAVTVEGTGEGVVEAIAEDALEGGVDVTAGAVGSLRFDDTNFYMKISAQVWKKVAHSAL